MRIDHREPIVHLQIRIVANGKPVEYAYERVSDGTEVAEGGTVTSLCWDGDVLVFTGRSQSSNGLWTMSFRYELLEEGRRLRAVEQVRGGGRYQDNIWMFRAAVSTSAAKLVIL